MDSIQFHHIKIEKSRRVLNFPAMRVFTNLFRLIELLLLLVLISKLFFRIPVAVKLSGDVFKEIAVFLVSPRFVFVLGNAIVITLFAKSGRNSSGSSSKTDLYKEFLEKSEKRSEIVSCEIEKRRKQRLSTNNKPPEKRVRFHVQSYRRSQSEKFEPVVKPANCVGKLKRYESDKVLRICDSDNRKLVKYSYPEDCMSNEEFRDKIEAFIARQKRLQKDEEHLVI